MNSESALVSNRIETVRFPKLAENSRISLGDASKAGMDILLMLHAEGISEEFPVASAFEAGGKVYLLLRRVDMYEPDNLMSEALVQLENAESVRLASTDEVTSLTAAALAASHQDVATLLARMGVQIASDERQMELRRQITHVLYFDNQLVAPDTKLRINELSNVHGFVSGRLSAEGSATKHYFNFHTPVQLGASDYLIIKYPPERTAEDDFPPFIVVRVTGPQSLKTISRNELMQHRRRFVDAVSRPELAPASTYEPLFGPIHNQAAR